jgi:hypothetical protein
MARAQEVEAARETAVLNMLKEASDGFEIFEIVERLPDNECGSERTVRNTVNRLCREKRIIRQRSLGRRPGAPSYKYLHPENVAHQPSLFDSFPEIERADVETRTDIEFRELSSEEQTRQARGKSVLQKIAESHLSADVHAEAIVNVASQFAAEDPVEMLLTMAQWVVHSLNEMGMQFRETAVNNKTEVSEPLAHELNGRLIWARSYFHRLFRLDRPIENIEGIMTIPVQARDYRPSKWHPEGIEASINVPAAAERLRKRVFGGRILDVVTPIVEHKEAVGTDASVADIFLRHAQGSFVPPDPVYIMASAAALMVRADGISHEYQDFDIHPDKLDEYKEHKAAIEGLVLSPTLKNAFAESDLKHARSAAMDLRQYYQDRRAVMRDAAWRPVGEAPLSGVRHRPNLLFRDGRLFPLVHRIQDYENDNLYGEIVRREIEQFANTSAHVFSRVYGDTIYSAAVKSPSMPWIAPLTFWYLHVNKVKKADGTLVITEPEVYSHIFSDTAVSHLLFLGLAKSMNTLPEGSAFITFRVLRRFSDIGPQTLPAVIESATELRLVDEDSEQDWQEYIRQRIEKKKDEHAETTLEEEDYRPFINLCVRVAVSMVYAAPCSAYKVLVEDDGSGAHFLLPRLEVAVEMPDAERENKHLESMLGWLVADGFVLDDGHTQPGYDTGDRSTRIPVLVPDVVMAAHRAATFARDRLGDEVKQELDERIAKLSRFFKKGV